MIIIIITVWCSTNFYMSVWYFFLSHRIMVVINILDVRCVYVWWYADDNYYYNYNNNYISTRSFFSNGSVDVQTREEKQFLYDYTYK